MITLDKKLLERLEELALNNLAVDKFMMGIRHGTLETHDEDLVEMIEQLVFEKNELRDLLVNHTKYLEGRIKTLKNQGEHDD